MPFQKGNKLAKGGARPGSGPKPSEIRGLCASKFYRNVPILDRIARSNKSSDRDRIAAILALAKVGLAEMHEHTGKDGGPIETEDTLVRILANGDAARLASGLARSMARQPGSNGESAN